MGRVCSLLLMVVLCGRVALADDVAGAEAAPECVIPFTYMGMEHKACINLNGARPWCSTDKVYNGSWAYCKEVKQDLITNDHFLKLLEEGKKLAQQIEDFHKSKQASTNQCNSCIEKMRPIAKEINLQKKIFLDQNRRLLGLDVKVKKLEILKATLLRYDRRRHCRQTDHGMDYLGTKSLTQSGRKCQAWSAQSPQKHSFTANDMYPDNRASRASNYCRNPDNIVLPWCYTTDPKVRWEKCAIPKCNVDCRYDEKGAKHLPWCDEYKDMICPDGYRYYQNYCYRADFGRALNFGQAEQACARKGGHLASVHSYGENNFIRTLIPSGSRDRFWIGATDAKTEGHWVWTDNTPFKYTYWHSGEPNNYRNEDCAHLNYFRSSPQTWNDAKCGGSMRYICKVKAKAT